MRKNKLYGYIGVLSITALLAMGCQGPKTSNIEDPSATPTSTASQTDSGSQTGAEDNNATSSPEPTKSDSETPGQSGKVNIDAIVQLTTDKDTYTSKDQLKFVISNVGDTLNISFGRAYKLEVKEDEVYKEVPLDLMFTEDMIIVEPGKDFSQEVDLKDLAPGNYRLVKDVFIDNQETNSEMPAMVTLQKDFVIE